MGGAVLPLPQYAFMAWCSVRGSTGKCKSYQSAHYAVFSSLPPLTINAYQNSVQQLLLIYCLSKALKLRPKTSHDAYCGYETISLSEETKTVSEESTKMKYFTL
jgi:hypothetical protein